MRVYRRRCPWELRLDFLQGLNTLLHILSLPRWQGQLQLRIGGFGTLRIGLHIISIGTLFAFVLAELPVALSDAKHRIGPHGTLGISRDHVFKGLNGLPPFFQAQIRPTTAVEDVVVKQAAFGYTLGYVERVTIVILMKMGFRQPEKRFVQIDRFPMALHKGLQDVGGLSVAFLMIQRETQTKPCLFPQLCASLLSNLAKRGGGIFVALKLIEAFSHHILRHIPRGRSRFFALGNVAIPLEGSLIIARREPVRGQLTPSRCNEPPFWRGLLHALYVAPSSAKFVLF